MKFSKQVENTLGKGEIAHYKQFLLFPQCFQKTCTADTYKPGLVWEMVNSFSQYSFRGLMIVIATRLSPLSPMYVVSTMVMWASS